MKPQHEHLKKFIKDMNQRPVTYYPIYRNIMGSVAGGVMLSQLMFWWGAVKEDEFYKSDAELMKETGLTEWEVKNEKFKLRSLGFIEYRMGGTPRSTHYKVDYDKFIDLISHPEHVLQMKVIRRPRSESKRSTFSEWYRSTRSDPTLYRDDKEKKEKSAAPENGAVAVPVGNHKKGKKYNFTETHMKAAKWFYDCLKKPIPDLLPPKKFDAWANDFRLLMDVDGREKKLTVDVVTWLTTSPHKDAQFWLRNVQCPAKLRDKFAALVLVMQQAKEHKANGANGHAKTNGVAERRPAYFDAFVPPA